MKNLITIVIIVSGIIFISSGIMFVITEIMIFNHLFVGGVFVNLIARLF